MALPGHISFRHTTGKNTGRLAEAGMGGISAPGNTAKEVVLCIAAIAAVIAQGVGTEAVLIQTFQSSSTGALYCGHLRLA